MQKKNGNPRNWIYKAEEDFRTATALFRSRKARAYDNVCFFAQQCIEKYLKAILTKRRCYFPKTHNLLELLNLAKPKDPTLELLRPFLERLNPYSVAFRYPGENAVRKDAKQALLLMTTLRIELRVKLGLKA